MRSTASTAEVMEQGLECLLEQLGPVETERFISIIIRERFDYTEWRKALFGDDSAEDINSEAAQYSQEHPFHPKRRQLAI